MAYPSLVLTDSDSAILVPREIPELRERDAVLPRDAPAVLVRDELRLAEFPVALDHDELTPLVSELFAVELSPSATVSIVGSSNHSPVRGSLLSVVEVPCAVPVLCECDAFDPM